MWRCWILLAALGLVACDPPKGKTASQIQAEAEQVAPLEDLSALGIEMYPSENGLATKDAPADSIVATSNAEGVTLDAFRVTNAPAKEVAVFYMARLTEPVETEAGGVISIEGINKAGDRVRVTASEKSGRTAFTVSVRKSSALDKTPPEKP